MKHMGFSALYFNTLKNGAHIFFAFSVFDVKVETKELRLCKLVMPEFGMFNAFAEREPRTDLKIREFGHRESSPHIRNFQLNSQLVWF
jgi:hypothetical protein